MCPNKMKIQHTKNLEREKKKKKQFSSKTRGRNCKRKRRKGRKSDERREAKERGKTGGVCSRVRCGAVCRGRASQSLSLFFFFLFSFGFPLGFQVKCGQVRLSPVKIHKIVMSFLSVKKKKKNSSKLDISIEFQSNMFQRLNNVV